MPAEAPRVRLDNVATDRAGSAEPVDVRVTAVGADRPATEEETARRAVQLAIPAAAGAVGDKIGPAAF